MGDTDRRLTRVEVAVNALLASDAGRPSARDELAAKLRSLRERMDPEEVAALEAAAAENRPHTIARLKELTDRGAA